ncbi:hypothetical protein [Stutzerimonas kirkiae]|uniref:hypothetical protein n=1 Tax=Stutzerimonas kirkiae TaxID=2211392 RepID=UPI001037AE00|nr:hypothetical protein [Stutzerimonas kirkiae]
MLKPTIHALFITTFLTGCAAQPHQNEKTVGIGDSSGHTQVITIKQSDIANACDLSAFEDGFKYTYMSMWNGRIEEILKTSTEQSATDYYSKLFFNSEPNTRAVLDKAPETRANYSYCQESSYQQGKISGFIYSIEDLKRLEEKSPM